MPTIPPQYTNNTPGFSFQLDNDIETNLAGNLVGSLNNVGVYSDRFGDRLINRGKIFAHSDVGVLWFGDHARIFNDSQASIIGGGNGVDINADSVDIINRGTISGGALFGVQVELPSLSVNIFNHGVIYGGTYGVLWSAPTISGTTEIGNFGTIRSPSIGIRIDTPAGAGQR